jgi:2-polyprenyl-3-methyl-5-hydroxy-6-metoxy-1,4-benzoquinol methylase
MMSQKSNGLHFYADLGMRLQKEGKLGDAVEAFQKALALKPTLSPTTTNFASFHEALEVLAEVQNSLGSIYDTQGKLNETIMAYLHAIKWNPKKSFYWVNFARSLKSVHLTYADDNIKKTILKCFSREDVNPQNLANASLSLLKLDGDFQRFLYSLANVNDDEVLHNLHSYEIPQYLNNALLLELLAKTIISDPMIEKVMTRIRKALLQLIDDKYFFDKIEKILSFIYALASQCYLNEYVYFETPEEAKKILHVINHKDVKNKSVAALIGCYRPLSQLPYSQILLSEAKASRDPLFIKLVTQQIKEPEIERRLSGEIPTLAPIHNAISREVQSQYEENPYPRWIGLDRKEPETIPVILKRSFPQLSLDFVTLEPGVLQVLIAGCGTGQHALDSACNYQNAAILAIDLSLSSLSYAARKARELQLTNAAFLQADILDLKELHRQFDFIECVGVLHHMASPFEGWRILCELLKPKGWMLVGLYSEIAREDIVAARELISLNHYSSSLNDIRKCRQHILSLPDDHLVKRVSQSLDFYTTSACRDLLFHVHEHRLSIPQIAKMIQELGLEFVGFHIQRQDIKDRYHARFPDDPLATSLENWNIFERDHPETFLGMYQMWLRKQ